MNCRYGLVWLILASLPRSVSPQELPSPAAREATPYRISLNVNLVLLHASVVDRQHHFTSNLKEQDFEVYEEGIRQTISLFRYEDVPVTVGLVIDHSGSMRRKLDDVIAAARVFIHSSRTEDEMFVVNFNDKVILGGSGKTKLTNNADTLAAEILNTPTSGKTALYDAIVNAQERLSGGSQDKKVLILVSDGGDNASSHSLADVLDRIEKSNALVYTIGIFDEDDPDRNPAVLRRLAHVTGGEAFFPQELSEVVPICQKIAEDIRNQYTIGYLSNNLTAPGAYRSIKVVARGAGKHGLIVRTRSGYIAK